MSFSIRLSLPKILILGMSLRGFWVLLCPNEPISDQVLYHEYARMMAQGRGYSFPDGTVAGWWPVGYSALLAVFYRLVGVSYTVAYGVNLALGCLSIVTCYLLARDLVSVRAGQMAALLFALHPTFICYTTIFGSENAAIPGALLFVWLCISTVEAVQHSHLLAICAGFTLGATAYVRAPVMLFGSVPLLMTWIWKRSLIRVLSSSAIIAVVSILVLVPWGFRMQREFGRFSLFSLNGASNLWMGNHPGSDGGYSPLPVGVLSMPLAEREDYLKEEAVSFILEHPLHYAAMCGVRTISTLKSDTIAATWNETGLTSRFGPSPLAGRILKLLCSGYHYALMVGVLTSMLCVLKRRSCLRAQLLLLSTMVLAAVPFVFIVGGNRYHLPMMSIACVLVGVVLSRDDCSGESNDSNSDRLLRGEL